MTNKSVFNLMPGDVLWDMHNYIEKDESPYRIEQPHRELQRIRIVAEGGGEFIQKAVTQLLGRRYSYTNKLLVVMDYPERLPDNAKKQIVKAAWSYDDRNFGLMKIEVDVP